MIRTTLLVGLSLVLLAGCETLPKDIKAKESATPSLADALQAVENNVRQASLVTLSDFYWNAPPVVRDEANTDLHKDVQEAQCLQKVANPLLPVISGAYSVALQGAITKAATGSAGGTAAPPGMSVKYQYQVSTKQQQQVTVPITFVSALELGNFYFAYQARELSDLGAGKTKALCHLATERHNISSAVLRQVKAYNPNMCPKTSGRENPIAPTAANVIG